MEYVSKWGSKTSDFTMQTQTAVTAIQTEGLATGQGVDRWFPAKQGTGLNVGSKNWCWRSETSCFLQCAPNRDLSR